MAFKHGSLAKVYVNGYDLSAYLKNVSSPVNAGIHEVTTFGATAKAYIPGLIDATLSEERELHCRPNQGRTSCAEITRPGGTNAERQPLFINTGRAESGELRTGRQRAERVGC